MSEPDGFVERPTHLGRRRSTGVVDRLRETARNGQAIVYRPKALGGICTLLRKEGLKLRQTINGAPVGYVYCWAERIADTNGGPKETPCP